MMHAVFDCNVIIAAIGWAGNPRHCLNLVTGGQVKLCVTPGVWDEYDRRVVEVLAEKKPGVNARPILNELVKIVLFTDPAPLGKQRSRDEKDDQYIACALGCGAKYIVTNDRDLLDLEKPFGIQIVTPVQFLLKVRGKTG